MLQWVQYVITLIKTNYRFRRIEAFSSTACGVVSCSQHLNSMLPAVSKSPDKNNSSFFRHQVTFIINRLRNGYIGALICFLAIFVSAIPPFGVICRSENYLAVAIVYS